MDNEFKYELTTKFKYAHGGDELEASFITLTAPTSKNMKECAYLKQAFHRALPEGDDKDDNDNDNDNDNKTKDDKIGGNAIMALLMRSKDVELSHILAHAQILFSSGIAQVEGVEKLTKPLLNLMSLDDLQDMTGEYLANFILASFLQKMNEK